MARKEILEMEFSEYVKEYHRRERNAKRIGNMLRGKTVRQVAAMSRTEFLKIPGFGKKALTAVDNCLYEDGMWYGASESEIEKWEKEQDREDIVEELAVLVDSVVALTKDVKILTARVCKIADKYLNNE